MSVRSIRSQLPRRLSPAAIDRYRGCPQTAYLQFVAKAPADHVVTPARMVGNAIHDALDAFLALQPDERSEQRLHRLLRSAWKRLPRRDAFASPEEEGFYGRQALDQLTAFLGGFDTSVQPLARERWIQAPLPNGTVVYGKVDRLDQVEHSGQSMVDVIDYKSGRCTLEDVDLVTDSAAQAYLLAAERHTGLPVRRVRYLYLAAGREARWEVEREDVEAARCRLDDLTRTMHTDGSFEARPGAQCQLCPFVAACPARPDAARG